MMKKINNDLLKVFPKNPYHPFCWIIGKPEIGKGTWIGPFTVIDAKRASLSIGRGCDISCGVHIYTHNTAKRCVTARKYNKVDTAPVRIGDHVFIGANATILMNTVVGDNSIIGAGCVILEGMKIPPYSVVAGVPGKVVKTWKKTKMMK